MLGALTELITVSYSRVLTAKVHWNMGPGDCKQGLCSFFTSVWLLVMTLVTVRDLLGLPVALSAGTDTTRRTMAGAGRQGTREQRMATFMAISLWSRWWWEWCLGIRWCPVLTFYYFNKYLNLIVTTFSQAHKLISRRKNDTPKISRRNWNFHQNMAIKITTKQRKKIRIVEFFKSLWWLWFPAYCLR